MISLPESKGAGQLINMERLRLTLVLLTEDDTDQGEYHKLTDDQK